MFGLSAGSVLLHLLDWVRLHKADVDEKAKEVLQSESPAEHRDYWDVVSSTKRYNLHPPCLGLWNWLSHALLLTRAGCELHPAGQVGGGQADADEASCSTSCSEEHVQADGQSAQQDAILQCMKCSIFICQLYLQIQYISHTNIWLMHQCIYSYICINHRGHWKANETWSFCNYPSARWHADVDRVSCQVEPVAWGSRSLPAG